MNEGQTLLLGAGGDLAGRVLLRGLVSQPAGASAWHILPADTHG